MYQYKGAGVLLYHRQRKTGDLYVLLGKRRVRPGAGQWSVFGGGMSRKDKGSFQATAKREFREELTIKSWFKRKNKMYLRRGDFFRYWLPFFQYHTYYIRTTKLIPSKARISNFEFSETKWFRIDQLPVNLHAGVLEAVMKLRRMETGKRSDRPVEVVEKPVNVEPTTKKKAKKKSSGPHAMVSMPGMMNTKL